jgi:hypothetical protein
MLSQLFKQRYLAALDKFSLFYDDFCEYGDRAAEQAFYFIPGIDGVPGQIRFALPGLHHVFGPRIYVRCLHLDEFSATRPIWEKFTTANIDKKRDQIVRDLRELSQHHAKVYVMVSSNGFYDFLYAYGQLGAAVLAKAELLWVSVAPDFFRPTLWEGIFYRFNGFDHNGYRWFASPNHNWLSWINPETATSHTWKHNGQKKIFYKNDLESRLSLFGMQWSFNSLGAFNACLEHEISQSQFPLSIPAYVLVATNDGYWYGRPPSDIDALLDKYLSVKQVLHRHASHLWVLVPDNLQALLQAAKEGGQPVARLVTDRRPSPELYDARTRSESSIQADAL